MLLSACWIPENFDAKVDINKDGSYTFTYDGTLTFAPALAEAKSGSLGPREEADLRHEAEELKREPGFKKVEYLGKGRYKVFVERSGKPGEPLYFISREMKIVSVLQQPDGTIAVSGTRPSKKNLEDLNSVGAKIDGSLSVSLARGLTVVRHNAQSEPSFWGLIGTYKWEIKSPDADPLIVVRPSIVGEAGTPQPGSGTSAASMLDTFDGSTKGEAHGITYATAPQGRGAVFSRVAESRIEYRSGIPREGTLEWWLKIDGGYRFDNFALRPDESCALVFATDVQGGDVTWPGATRVIVCKDGQIVFEMAQAKYNDMPHQQLKAPVSQFRFGEWHALGVSYGSKGQAIMLDGQVMGSAPKNTQWLGAAGTGQGPADIPTIGEAVSHVWQHRQYSGGFDGVVSKFRSSIKQNDWVITKQLPQPVAR